MKQETGKKSKLWLWIVIAVIALLAVAGVVLGIVLSQPAEGPNVDPTDAVPTSEVYWNIDKVKFTQDSETGLSTREKGEDGLYHFRFASQGKLLEMATADKQLVNYIDTMDACGLQLDADGLIIDVLDVKTIAVETAKNFYVKSVSGNMVTVNSSVAMNGMDITFELNDNTYVMDVRPGIENPGAAIEIDVMDVVCVYGSEEVPAEAIYLTDRPASSPLYLRVDRFYSSAEASTTRVPDENGVYTIPFAINGKVEQLKCKDKAVVTGIDVGTDAKQVMGLIFDEEGYITGTILAATAARAKLACQVYNVTAINGNAIEATRKLSGNEQGKVVNFNLTEETQIIMNEEGCGHFIGARVSDIKMDDRVVVWTDMQNNALYIKVDRRKVEADMYYNFKKMSVDAEKVTTRLPDAKGYYVFELASKGKVVTVKTKDKALASKLDANSYQFFGLKVEKGIIKEYYDKDCLTGGYGIGGTTRYVTQVMATIVQISGSSKFDSFSNYILTPNTEIYDMTQDPGTKVGSKTELQLGDRIIAARDVENNMTHIYVLDRYYSGCKLYYNASRKYDATNKVTTRKPEETGENAGYYVYTMYCEGKEVVVKTKNKDIANAIDAENAPIVAMKVSKDNIVKAAYPAIAGIMYSAKRFNYNYVGEITADKTVSCYYFSNGERKEASASYKMAADCKVYNVSTNFNKNRGEKATLKVGDRIQAIQNYKTGELTHIWIMGRAMNSPLYMHTNRIAPTDGVTNRIQNADGYYEVELFVDGKIKTFKTKDAKLMGLVDSYGSETFFAMEVKGNVIQKVDSASASVKAVNAVVSSQDVMKISGKTITTERKRPGQSNTGATKEFTYSSSTKIYNVSYYAGEARWKPAKLEKGDRITVYSDRDGNVTYIFIMYPHLREKGYESKCSHCNKTVWWEPYTGSFITTAVDEIVHYYQPADYTRGQGTVGKNVNDDNSVPRFTAVFDMNGKTLTSTGRNFLVYYDLVVIDSVGGGVLQANGYNGGDGGNFMVTGGTVTINDGVTLRQNDAPEAKASLGGNFVVSNLTVTETGKPNVGKVILNDAKLEAWDCKDGGNIKLKAGTELTIKKATVTGGDIVVAEDAKVKLNGSNIKISGEGIDLRSGAKIAESKLSGSSKVVIQANGIFTEKLSNAAAQKAFYEPEFKYYPIEVKDSALWTDRDPSKPDYVAEPEIPELPAVTKVDNAALSLDANSQAKCPVCNEVVTWTAITNNTAVQSLVKGNHYYLPNDLTFEKADIPYIQVVAGESACLHLNDHNITATNALAIQVNGSLNIMGNGTVSGNGYADAALLKDGRPDLHAATLETFNSKAVANIYGGTYVKSAANDDRTANITKNGVTTVGACANHIVEVHGNGGTINMFEGAVIDARNTKKSAVMSYWGMFNLYGGTVYGGSSTAVNAGNWTETKSGGISIYGGTVQAASGAAMSGSGHNKGNGPATLNLFGGQINGNVTFNADTQVTVAGAPVLTKLTQPANKDGSFEGKIILGKLTEGAHIPVTGTEEITFQNENAADYVKYFKSLTDIEIVHQNFAISFYYVPDPELPEVPEVMPAVTEDLQFIEGSNWALCPLCKEYVKWTPITQKTYGANAYTTSSLPDGTHLYLAEDITYTGSSVFMYTPSGAGKSACFHLNGHDFTATNAHMVQGYTGKLNIMGSGTVSGNGKSGATFVVNTSDDFNGGIFLHSGTYTKAAGNATGVVQINSNGGRIWVGPDATITTSKGQLAAKVAGGNLISGNLIIEGTVEGGYVESAPLTPNKDGLQNFVIVEIKNADLQGGAKFAADTKIALRGETKIAGLDMTSGAKITASELTGTALVTVKANGIFTDKLSNVNEQKAFYAPIVGYRAVEIKDGALWTEDDPAVDEEPVLPEAPTVPALPALLKVDNSNLVLDASSQAKCPVCDEVVTWTAISDASKTQALTNGHYYLANDIVYEAADLPYIQAVSGVTACLHLNDHNLTATNAQAVHVNGTLSIMGNGTVSGNGFASMDLISSKRPDLHAATLEANGSKAVVNLYGGTYVKSAANDDRTADVTKSGVVSNVNCGNHIVEIHGNGGTINMFEGAVIDARNTKKGAVMSYWGMFNLYGGTVYGGSSAAATAGNWTSTKSGGVSIYGGTVQAASGAALNATGVKEGPSTLNLFGGRVNGNITLNANAQVTVAGAPVLSRLTVPAGVKITLGEMTEGASVTVMASGVFTTMNADAAAYVEKAYFVPYQGYKSITVVDYALSTEKGTDEPVNPDPTPDPEPEQKFDNSNLTFAEGSNKAMCPLCQKEVEWIALTQQTHGASGIAVTAADQHYYLAEDITYTGDSHFITGPGSNRKLCIHLNGHNFTGTQGRFLFGYASKSNVMGNGIVASGMNKAGNGGVAWNTNNQNDVSIDLYGGTYTVTAGNDKGSPIAIQNNGGTITVHEGATVIGSATAPAIYVGTSSARASSLTVKNATVVGYIEIKTPKVQENAFTSTVVLDGVNVDSVKLEKGVSFTVAGNTVIRKLEVADGAKITIGDLGSAAKIDVIGNGVISEANDKMSAYLGNFTSSYGCSLSVNGDKALVATNNAKVINNADLALSEGKALCPVCNKEVAWTAIADITETYTMIGGGHYYLASDITFEGLDANGKSVSALSYPYSAEYSRQEACLHLNGHNVTNNNGQAIFAGNYLNVMGNGTVSGNLAADNRGATVEVNSSVGRLNLYGGTYVKPVANTKGAIVGINNAGGTINMFEGATVDATGTASETNAGAVILNAGADKKTVFNLYGGIIKNGTTNTGYGGNIRLLNEYCAFNMYGGAVTGGKAPAQYGGNIYSKGTVNIHGGTVSDGLARIGGNIAMSSAPLSVINATVKNGVADLTAGGTASHGGNISVDRSTLYIGIGSQILDGAAPKGHAGNVRCYSTVLTMDGGLVSGGTSKNNNGNIWVYCDLKDESGNALTMDAYFNGGVSITASGELVTKAGNGLNVSNNIIAHVNGGFSVIDPEGAAFPGVSVGSTGASIVEEEGWFGTMNR